MHWSNGKFHQDITVGGKVYITDHKHLAIFGNKDYTGFGESDTSSYLYGKDVGITATNKFYSDSTDGSNLWSKKYIHIEAGSENANHESDLGIGIEIISKNGPASFIGDGNAVDIKALGNSVNITAGTYLNLKGTSGITVNNSSYGTTLPTSGNTEGRIFFKLIS